MFLESRETGAGARHETDQSSAVAEFLPSLHPRTTRLEPHHRKETKVRPGHCRLPTEDETEILAELFTKRSFDRVQSLLTAWTPKLPGGTVAAMNLK